VLLIFLLDYIQFQLFAEDEGYEIYEMILDDLPKVLNKGAYVTFEIGYNQGEILKARIINKYPHVNVNLLKDINVFQEIYINMRIFIYNTCF
jgi:release factor glutamine methyltransferase